MQPAVVYDYHVPVMTCELGSLVIIRIIWRVQIASVDAECLLLLNTIIVNSERLVKPMKSQSSWLGLRRLIPKSSTCHKS